MASSSSSNGAWENSSTNCCCCCCCNCPFCQQTDDNLVLYSAVILRLGLNLYSTYRIQMTDPEINEGIRGYVAMCSECAKVSLHLTGTAQRVELLWLLCHKSQREKPTHNSPSSSLLSTQCSRNGCSFVVVIISFSFGERRF